MAISATRSGRELGRNYATHLDSEDKIKDLRKEFTIPTKRDLKSKRLSSSARKGEEDEQLSIYFCGNSLGLQPLRTMERIHSHLAAWAQKGVLGHFTELEGSTLPPFLHVDDTAAKLMAPLVGARSENVAVMETLTANLHLMMASFYRPTKDKFKIIIEGKAFPSDHYAVESQIRHHGFDPKEAMIILEPETPELATLSTPHIISVIEQHASSTALILLPGIQYYSGQYLDIKQITAAAHAKDVLIGWDLAHAVGNVLLELDNWNVDFAVWCNYKYVNSGPGAIGGLYVNSRYGKVDVSLKEKGVKSYQPRLSGWWGGDKAIRFEMGKDFVPIAGAAGFQVGNPSALALTAVVASLEVFALTSMASIREKSVALTNYLEELLLRPPLPNDLDVENLPYQIITPSDPSQRGAQLSVRLQPGLLEGIMKGLEEAGVIVDERKPDVIRVAPAPLYNTFEEVWDFVVIFTGACATAQAGQINGDQEAQGLEGQDDKGWAVVK